MQWHTLCGGSRRAVLLLLFCFFFFFVTLPVVSAQDGLTGKEPLNPKGCGDDNNNDMILGNECDDTNNGIPKNGFVLPYYSSLPAFGSSYGVPLAWLFTVYLHEILDEYVVTFSFDGDCKKPENSQKGDYSALVILRNVQSTNIQKFRASWWWEYNMTFVCCHGGYSGANNQTGFPLKNQDRLDEIKFNLQKTLSVALEALEVLNYRAMSHGILGFAVSDPRSAEEPFVPGTNFLPTMAPTVFPAIANTGTYAIDISMGYWDTRRYVGLAIFVFTVVFTTVTTVLAARRQYRKHQETVWGNLASTEGVESLLNVGYYKVSGTKMIVYDKTNQGYRDDDSMLIGGFEQTSFVTSEVAQRPQQQKSCENTVDTPETHPSS